MTWYIIWKAIKSPFIRTNEFTKIAIYNINIQKAILFLFTLAMKYQKKSVKDIKSNQKFKIPRNKFNQGGERSIH